MTQNYRKNIEFTQPTGPGGRWVGRVCGIRVVRCADFSFAEGYCNAVEDLRIKHGLALSEGEHWRQQHPMLSLGDDGEVSEASSFEITPVASVELPEELRRYIERGARLASVIEDVAANGIMMIAPKYTVDQAIEEVIYAQSNLPMGKGEREKIAAYRRISALRYLASAWLASGGDLDSEDLHDMAGACRIVKRAAREAGILPSGEGAGNPATPQADQAGASASAGEGDKGPAEVLPARAGERVRSAKPDKVRTHHNPRGEG